MPSPEAGVQDWQDYNYYSGVIINGSGNLLENSTIAWSAGNGVTVLGSSNTLTNNLIENTGYTGNDATGINTFGAGHKDMYNTVHTSGRYAITVNSYPVSPDNNDVSYNNFYNACMLGRDCGEIYTGDTTVTGTSFHNNWVHDTQSLFPGVGINAAYCGIYIDTGGAGYVVQQNVAWNNQYYNICLNGAGVTTPNNNRVSNNSIPDVNSTGYMWLNNIPNCGTAQFVDNLILVPIVQSNSACTTLDDTSTAPGATQMTSSVQVGCNFTGCSSEGPPTVSGSSVAASIAVQPYNMTVSAGQPVTFAVTGAGSGTLTFQWQRNGSNITGAISATYVIPATAPPDSGAVFTVTVTNSLGSVASNPATLTVN